MHGPVTHTFGYMTMNVIWGITGTETYFKKEVGFCIAAAIDIFATICVADVFWRAVDIPVVRFAKWVEEVCIVTMD